MAIVKLKLPGKPNSSLQAKPSDVTSNTTSIDNGAWDIIYFTRISSLSGKQNSEVYRMGKCVGIIKELNNYTVHVEMDDTAQTPNSGDYIFFGKENKVNISGVRSYYAEVEMKNDSYNAAKLFSVGSEATSSSK